MMRKAVPCLILMLTAFSFACAEEDEKPPRIVSTVPENGSQDVDPALNEMSVTFDEEMIDGNWSWAYEDENTFPQIVGQAYYDEGNRINRLPVKLEPNKEYAIWINHADYKNFKDKAGNPAIPYRFTFKTR